VLFIIIFGTLSFPISPSWARMRMTTKIAKFSQPLVNCLKPCSQQTNWTELNCSSRTAALQQCSQSASWRWRAWPITRRVIGSTWWRSVQFVYCKHGFSVFTWSRTARTTASWSSVCWASFVRFSDNIVQRFLLSFVVHYLYIICEPVKYLGP